MTSIQVPAEWFNFITLALSSPNIVDWAKSLLSSQLWTYLIEGSTCKNCFPFVLPATCPSDLNYGCQQVASEQLGVSASSISNPDAAASENAHQVVAPATTSIAHAHRKRKEKTPVVETEVRRSCTLEQLNKGFKKQICKDRNCLSCTASPPIIAPKVIKNLSTSFCRASAKDCTDEMLHQPKKKGWKGSGQGSPQERC